VYGLCNALSSATPLLLLPIYTVWLTPAEFGTLSLFSTVVALAVPVVSLASGAAVQRRHFNLDSEEFACYVRTAFLVIVAIGTFIFAVSLVTAFANKNVVGVSSELFSMAVIVAVAISIQQIILSIWQTEQRISEYIRFQSFFLLMLIGLPVVFVVILKRGLYGAIAGIVIANVFSSSAMLWPMLRNGLLLGPVSKKHMFHLLRFGGPLLPHLIAGWVIAMFDRFLIAKYWGLAAVGIYSFAFQAAQTLSLLSGSFNQAFTPWLYHVLARGTKDDDSLVSRVLGLYAFVVIAFGLCVAYLFQVLVPVYAVKYMAALDYAPWLIAGFTINALYRISATFQMYYERTAEIAVGTVVSGVISISMNLYFVKKFGPISAAWSNVIGFGLLFIWTTFRAITIRDHTFGKDK